MDIKEIRLQRVRKLIVEREEKNAARFAEKTGLQAAYVSRLWTEKAQHKRNIGERVARRIEKAYELPSGWLDYDERMKMTDSILLTGYQAASSEAKEFMETIARRALEKSQGKPDDNDRS